jgi:hypothetical protein
MAKKIYLTEEEIRESLKNMGYENFGDAYMDHLVIEYRFKEAAR